MKFLLLSIAFIRINNIDFSTGDDLTEIRVDNARQCEIKCEQNKKCLGYVYSKNQGKCWPKDNLNGIRRISEKVEGGIKVE